MRTNRAITQNRLQNNVGQKSGCTPLFLRVLKSDLSNLLGQYMSFSGVEFEIYPKDDGHELSIKVAVSEFLELGKSQSDF